MANNALHESFDHGVGALSNAWNVDTSVAGQVTLRNDSGLMQYGGSASSGHGYGTYTINAKFDGSQPGPAIVFWPGDNKWPGQEIDMGEFAHDGSGRQYGIVHWNENGHDAYEYAVYDNVQTGVFHDYTMVWEPGKLTFQVDGRTVGTLNNHVPVDFDHGGMNNTIGMLNLNDNTSLTIRQVDFTPLGSASTSPSASSSTSSVASSTPATTEPAAAATSNSGSGGDIVLWVSQDAYKGNAQYTVSVDGQQIGGVRTASASHAAGEHDTVVISGPFSAGQHSVGITMTNDLWEAGQGDRNLYVTHAEFNGQSSDALGSGWWGGSFNLGGSADLFA